MKGVPFWKHQRGNFEKAAIVIPRHTYVNVIIPWYEPTMTNRAKQVAGVKEIDDAIFAANLIDHTKYLVFNLLQTLKHARWIGSTRCHSNSIRRG